MRGRPKSLPFVLFSFPVKSLDASFKIFSLLRSLCSNSDPYHHKEVKLKFMICSSLTIISKCEEAMKNSLT